MSKLLIVTVFYFCLITNSSIFVDVTVYHPVEEQTSSDPHITASGKHIDLKDPISHRWVAVSRDLEKHGFTFGKKIKVSGTGLYDGIWEIQDRMNKRWSKKIDLLIGENDPIGSWKEVTVELLND